MKEAFLRVLGAGVIATSLAGCVTVGGNTASIGASKTTSDGCIVNNSVNLLIIGFNHGVYNKTCDDNKIAADLAQSDNGELRATGMKVLRKNSDDFDHAAGIVSKGNATQVASKEKTCTVVGTKPEVTFICK